MKYAWFDDGQILSYAMSNVYPVCGSRWLSACPPPARLCPPGIARLQPKRTGAKEKRAGISNHPSFRIPTKKTMYMRGEEKFGLAQNFGATLIEKDILSKMILKTK
jgi:hypothetical protein